MAQLSTFGDIVHVHHYFATVIEAAALLLNVVLFHLVMRHSDFQMNEFRGVFLLTCVGDFTLSAIVLFSQPYILFEGGYMFLVPNGPLSGLSPIVDHIGMTLFCIMLHTNIVLVVCQFVWRNSLVCAEKSLIRVRRSFGLVPVVWCFPQIVTAVFCWIVDHDDALNEEGLRILSEAGWHFNETRAPYPSLTPGGALKTRIHHVYYLSSGLLGYIVIIWCQLGVLKYLRELGMPSTHKTQRAHAEVNKALVALALTPLVSIMPVSVVILSSALQVPLGATSAYLSVAVPIITLFNPIVTMYFIRPYRRQVARWIGGRSTRIADAADAKTFAKTELSLNPNMAHIA